MTEQEIAKLFNRIKFRATPQRIAVYKYLYENRTHPDALEIYNSVVKLNPSFSKTTVYNSLSALEECGLINKINVDGDSAHYDAHVDLHGHFVCDRCERIFDFDIKNIDCDMPDSFDVLGRYVCYRGLCPECK